MSTPIAVELSGHIGQRSVGCHLALLANLSGHIGFEHARLHGLHRDSAHIGASIQGGHTFQKTQRLLRALASVYSHNWGQLSISTMSEASLLSL